MLAASARPSALLVLHERVEDPLRQVERRLLARLEREDLLRQPRDDRRQHRLVAEVVDQVERVDLRLVDLLVEVEAGLLVEHLRDEARDRFLALLEVLRLVVELEDPLLVVVQETADLGLEHLGHGASP